MKPASTQLSLIPALQVITQPTQVARIARRDVGERTRAIEAVFVFWRELLSDVRSRMDKERAKKIGERIDDGYSVEDMQLGIIGCYLSEWHRGNNNRSRRYQDIELICRSAAKLDAFRDIAEQRAEKIMAERRTREVAASEQPLATEDARAKIDAILATLRKSHASK